MKIFLTAPSERKRSIAKPIFVQDWFPFETIPLSHMVKEISSCNFPGALGLLDPFLVNNISIIFFAIS